MSAEQTSSTSQLQDALAQVRARWAALAPRERQMITVMGWLLGLTLLFLIGVRPAWKTLQQAPAQLREVSERIE